MRRTAVDDAEMAQVEEDRFNIEVIKLLLQVAWADGEVDPAEAQMILSAGRSWHVPEATLNDLRNRLEKGNPLPSPDLSMLKKRPDDVLSAARALVLSDGKV